MQKRPGQPAKYAYSRNELFQLRRHLSKDGPRFPITQDELSKITGIPAATVRAIERKQRNLTDSVRWKILVATGASWNSKAKWVFLTGEPFEFARYAEYRDYIMHRPRDGAEELGKLFGELMKIQKMLPDSQWWQFYFRLEQVLNECRRDFRTAELEPIFYSFHDKQRERGGANRAGEAPAVEIEIKRKKLGLKLNRFHSQYQEALAQKGYPRFPAKRRRPS